MAPKQSKATVTPPRSPADAGDRAARRTRHVNQVPATPIEMAVERVQPSYVQVAAQLRSLILGGQLRPGDRLPAEGELSSTFGVSRSTTREALRLLAAEKLIETRRGVTGGAFVMHPDFSDIELALSTAINLAVRTDRLSQDELYEVWEITQVPAAAMAARRRTEDHVRRLFELSEPVTRHASEGELMVRAINFHGVILDAVGNRLLEIIARPLNAIGANALTSTQRAREFVIEANARHRRIAEAIADQDAERAAKEMAHDMAEPQQHVHSAGPRKQTAPRKTTG
jgi:GntR family transcriptional regulator, transcriptional repressor for pyruvate dehydrogenase complex